MEPKLLLLDIREGTIVDGSGLRTAIYGAGCIHRCPGCHNPESWDPAAGRPVALSRIMEVVLRNDVFRGVTFTGGDPFFQPDAFAELARRIKEQTVQDIWCYTGYRYEELVRRPAFLPLLSRVDVLVDGPFIQERKDPELRYRGSANQRIIDVPRSLEEGGPALWKDCGAGV